MYLSMIVLRTSEIVLVVTDISMFQLVSVYFLLRALSLGMLPS